MISFIALLILLVHVSADGQLIGCYSSLPSGFFLKETYTWQSSQYCANLCSGYNYFALTNGNQCYCGSSYPSDSGASDSSCSVACVGFPQESCGGNGFYDILAQSNFDLSNISKSGSSSSTSSSSSQTTTKQTFTNTLSNTSSTSSLFTSASSSSSSSPSSTSTSDTTTHLTTKATTTSSSSTTSPMTTDSVKFTSLLTTILENSSATVTSIVYITQSASSSDSPNSSLSKSSSSSSINKGAVVGGVVGGVLGFLCLLFAILFLLRHRIFSRYYNNNDTESILADDIAYEEALKSNNDNPFSSEEDKEADKILLGRRRLSDGSLADATDYGMKVLRVANPDDD
jgi:cell wall integrity and stress response component